MGTSFISTVKGLVRVANQWFLGTPERALDDAYEAALRIKSIEDNHFGGGKISPDYGSYGSGARSYFQSELKKYLNIAKVRLAEFKASSSVLQLSNQSITEIRLQDETSEEYRINVIDKPGVILKKLQFVDDVIARYSSDRSSASALVILPDATSQNGIRGESPYPVNSAKADPLREDIESIADKTGVLPRSILKTVDRIKRELDPKAEEEVVQSFRSSKARTVISIRLILLLIIVPLLTQQVAKNFIIGPVVDHYRASAESPAFLNIDMEEEALDELRLYEERLKFEVLSGRAPKLSEEEMEERLQEKALEIQEEAYKSSNDSIKNVFADLISVFVFVGLLLTNRRSIEVLKSFIDEVVYGLSDSAKAFIIILFTDTFVGFHSPHGWEVLLEGVAKHLGVAANHDFIFLFIATFPVILDTIFKYWIFRYLNRISPSAVATYRNMNE